MFVLFTVIVVLAALILVAVLFVNAWNLWSLIVNLGVSEGWADWFARDSFWTWVVVIVGLSVVCGGVKLVTYVIRLIADLLIGFVLTTLTKTSTVVSMVVAAGVTWLIGLGVAFALTERFFDWAANYPEHSAYFADPAWWTYLIMFAFWAVLVLPSRDNGENYS